jgi:hypothetical protein
VHGLERLLTRLEKRMETLQRLKVHGFQVVTTGKLQIFEKKEARPDS